MQPYVGLFGGKIEKIGQTAVRASKGAELVGELASGELGSRLSSAADQIGAGRQR